MASLASTAASSAPVKAQLATGAAGLTATSTPAVAGRALPGEVSPQTIPSSTTAATPATSTPPATESTPARAATVLSNLASTASSSAPSAASPANAAAARPIAGNVGMMQNFTAAVQSTTATLTGPNTGLLGQAIDAPRASVAPSTTLSANTLVEMPSMGRSMLPVRLAQTLSESGMFYESHLAKWSKGALSLETLSREPQARLNTGSQVMSKLVELAGMPEEAARLAGRQLQMLEGAPFLWQGVAWPGQNMQWLIREESAGEGGGGAEEGAAEWVTELNLILPRMGEVRAQLGLNGEHLRLRLLAADPTTRAALENALPLLAKGFEANGLQPVGMQVEAPSDHV